MKFLSTRGGETVSGPQAIIKGIASDGGLFVPETFPSLGKLEDLVGLSYQDLAAHILNLYFEELGEEKIREICSKAYDKKFPEEVVPLRTFDQVTFLELYHGRTHAFKDMALSILPYLLKASLEHEKDKREVVVLVATSGDTGKAALEGFKDVEGVRALVFYPKDGVSKVQKLQMATQEGTNLKVFALDGNFDDAQRGVKDIFADEDFASYLKDQGYELSSANSINIGRLIPQVVYYVSAYLRLAEAGKIGLGDEVNVCVPTGNFGNILAAYYAGRMGLPIKKFLVASNDNKVLTDFFTTSTYDAKRDLLLTSSPSMDILVSSNLERFLYHLSKEDSKKVASAMESLNTNGKYSREAIDQAPVFAGFANEEEVSQAIKKAYDEYSYVIDPHTAVGFSVYRQYLEKSGDSIPTLLASTASPFKFPGKVLASLGRDLSFDEFERLSALSDLMGLPIPENLAKLKTAPRLHKRVVKKGEMEETVKEVLPKKTFTVRVPASSANLGPGFDSLGLGLKLYNDFTFTRSEAFSEDNLILDAYRETFKAFNKDPLPVTLEIDGNIPQTRGLGSSAACIVGGVFAASYQIFGEVDKDLVLNIAGKIEGHPDNIGPAVFGGLLAFCKEDEKYFRKSFEVNENISFICIIPDYRISTKEARKALPGEISREDAIYNLGRLSILLASLKDLDEEGIRLGLSDRLHQPYRKGLIKDFDKIEKEVMDLGALGLYISGAGPSIMALVKKDSQAGEKIKAYISKTFPAYQVEELEVDRQGARFL